MRYFRIRNLDTYQHYKKRNPPWVKLHRSILNDYDFASLDDRSKWVALGLVLLASAMDNKIPADPWWIRQQLSLKQQPDLKSLEQARFIEMLASADSNASKMLASAVSQSESESESEEREKALSRPAGPPPGFVLFWETYPTRNGRKCGKAEALKAWKEVRCEPHAAEIVARLEDQIRHKKACDQNGKFVAEFPDAFRWIKKRRFNDEIQEIDA